MDGARSLWSKTFFLNFHTQKLAHFRWDPAMQRLKSVQEVSGHKNMDIWKAVLYVYTWVKNLFLFL